MSNSWNAISAVTFRVTHSLTSWLWTLSDTNNRADGFFQMAWLHDEGGGGGSWSPFFPPTKAFFLLHQKLHWAAGGTRAAVNPSSNHGNIEPGQWRKSRPYNFPMCGVGVCTRSSLHDPQNQISHLNVVGYLSSSPQLCQVFAKALIAGDTFTVKPSTIHHTLKRLSVKYVETKLYRPTHLAPLPWFAGNALKIQKESGSGVEDKAVEREKVQER